MRRVLCILIALPIFVCLAPDHVFAQSSAISASYAAGWNMVGVPTQTDLSPAGAIDAYASGSYFTPASPLAVACQGYWVYFTDPTSITLPAGAVGPTQSCPLQAGWNLVGNPFSGAAQLPSGVTAYHWNPDANRYDVVSAIPVGGAVWINSNTADTITLTYVPVSTRTPQTLEITNLLPGPYRIHVGDLVKLILPISPRMTVRADSTYLHLESSGVTGPLSCIGTDPSCALSLDFDFFTWRAVAPGTTSITVSPFCIPGVIACTGTSSAIQINILP